eukprot:TRINITY_DN27809_c0_g1_i1.p2 TRINITY_DN27809_c0_g1~~TRINITY_DN27809_c0_g1_i1.p2  ORF type:complete len:155 (+),score=20.88 TRINITY_DN27809_c0_g1_i1:133-597(+)
MALTVLEQLSWTFIGQPLVWAVANNMTKVSLAYGGVLREALMLTLAASASLLTGFVLYTVVSHSLLKPGAEAGLVEGQVLFALYHVGLGIVAVKVVRGHFWRSLLPRSTTAKLCTSARLASSDDAPRGLTRAALDTGARGGDSLAPLDWWSGPF